MIQNAMELLAGVAEEPVRGGSNGCSTNIDTNNHVSEKQPGSDQSFISATWGLVHDVKVWRVEGEGSGWETVSDEVHPQELDRDQSFWETKGSCKEDADNLTNVG